VPALTRFLEQMSEGIRIAGGFGAAMLNFGTMNPDPGAAIASANRTSSGSTRASRATTTRPRTPASTASSSSRRSGAVRCSSCSARGARGSHGRREPRRARSALAHAAGAVVGLSVADLHQDQTELRLYTRAAQQLEEELGKLQDLSKAQIVINRVTTGSWKDLSSSTRHT
jgi:hypothetical protein